MVEDAAESLFMASKMVATKDMENKGFARTSSSSIGFLNLLLQTYAHIKIQNSHRSENDKNKKHRRLVLPRK